MAMGELRQQCSPPSPGSIASIGFSYYVSNFGSYNKTYGSLGAAIGFMTWIWISTMIVLLGGELNAETGAADRTGHDGGAAQADGQSRGVTRRT